MRTVISGILLILFAVGSPLAQSFEIEAINPTDTTFPGGRGAEMMIVYTPEAGRETTGTNEWGSEAVILNGVVATVGTNNSTIPAQGFVVSGHGAARNWINEHLRPGQPVRYDASTVRIDDSPEGVFASLRWRVADMDLRLEELWKQGVEIQGALARLTELKAMIDFTPVDRLPARVRRANSIEEDIWRLELSVIDSPEGEIRAAWHRVAQSTPTQISVLIDEISATHLNVFLPEVIYGSQCIGVDETGLFPLFERFEGRDALAQIIEECHAKGIEVHAWIHCFYIGIPSSEEPPLIAESHPEWIAHDRQGRTQSVDETGYGEGYMYINPAHPEARRALIDAYVALVENYDLDGLQLDYIRYPNNSDWQNQWDYSDLTREMVSAELGFDPLAITPMDHPTEWQQWLDWRERTITTFVEEAVTALRAVRPEIRITSAVFPGIDSAIEKKGQNWAAWEERGLMNAIMPMAYAVESSAVADAVHELHEVVGQDSPTVIGIGPFMGLTAEQLVDQILTAREAGASGQTLFAWDSLDERSKEALRLGPWRTAGPADWSVE